MNAEIDPRISRTRGVVLDATAALIGEVGFGRTSIEAIAERSGVARSTIYRHWPNRPDLLVEAIRCTIALEPPPETGDLRHDLSVLLGGLADRLGSPETGPIMMSLIAEAKRDPQMASVFTRFVLERFGLIRSILEHAVDRGELKADVDPEQMTEDLVAPLFFRAFIRSALLDRDSVEDHIDRWIAAYAR
ncbi:MAG: TetR/AcrR family transcriptional regulator [Acidimicrobiia bacterium]|nr:TetR/AcrR family transcriptional regulator [Acidimicrobiia bacterium]